MLLYPSGFINAHTVRALRGRAPEGARRRRYKIVVNCADLPTSRAPGLGAIMGAIEEIRGNGGDLRLAELNETVRNIFEILGFNHLYRIFPSEMEAILELPRGWLGGTPGPRERAPASEARARPAGPERDGVPGRVRDADAGEMAEVAGFEAGARRSSWRSRWTRRPPT